MTSELQDIQVRQKQNPTKARFSVWHDMQKNFYRQRSLATKSLAKLMRLNDWIICRKAPLAVDVQCPICDNYETKIIYYSKTTMGEVEPPASLAEVNDHCKHLCIHCGHLFSSWLDVKLQSVNRTYRDYHGIYNRELLYAENQRSPFQLSLIRYAIKHLDGGRAVSILDFGCGSNTSPTTEMRSAGYDVRCCDILDGYPYDNQIFFQYNYFDSRWSGAFDAIVSIDVVEHLGNTLTAWSHLNKMLKPGGIMAHCFPTRLHYPLRHGYFSCPLHVSIFSAESLRILMAKTGFSLESIESFPSDVPFVFRFRKIREASFGD